MSDASDIRKGIVDEHEDGNTLASVARSLTELPWSRVKDLCKTGRVFVNGERTFDPVHRVRPGDEVEVRPTARKQSAHALEADRFVYRDAHVVVLRKPAGLSTTPYDASETDTLHHRAAETLRREDDIPKRLPFAGLRIVSRLDKNTTGLLVMARTRAASRGLEDQFREHSVKRQYLAIVHGTPNERTHQSYLLADRGDGLRGSWRGQGKPPNHAKRAVTHVAVERKLGAGACLISCHLETGRQHQIRIHLAEAGHPLVGERIYIRGFRGKRLEAPRPMLHATSLQFRHPVTGRPMRFEDQPPEDFAATVEELAGRTETTAPDLAAHPSGNPDK